MRILFCCQFYAPSIGGVQEVMRQVAERLVLRGHEVTVATSWLPDRTSWIQNGVVIKDFAIAGSSVGGMQGDLAAYQKWVLSESFDLVMINMAQQWTLDALIPVLKDVRGRKILIPCGFSCLYEPSYAKYYRSMPEVLRRFDHLIFHSFDYRDIRFTKQHRIQQVSVIPNGASETEFHVAKDRSFRQRLGISDDDWMFLTVGSFTLAKGHLDLVQAYLAADFLGKSSILLINANFYRPEVDASVSGSQNKIEGHFKEEISSESPVDTQDNGAQGHNRLKKVWQRITHRLVKRRQASRVVHFQREFASAVEAVHRQDSKKRVLLVDLPREDLVQAYMHADLFVFASWIEYSPLVLFESAAAGTPFLSAQVGNADEVARWTGAGVIGPSIVDTKGYTQIDLKRFAKQWSQLMQDKEGLRELGRNGKKNWAARFTWGRIVQEYEDVFQRVCAGASGVREGRRK
ncbi:MAG: glycosyltransferase family 4 protein [Nitrospira sp.]|nr:glycosyltransferase family 4 protein [Nitrospira sp.]